MVKEVTILNHFTWPTDRQSVYIEVLITNWHIEDAVPNLLMRVPLDAFDDKLKKKQIQNRLGRLSTF